MSETHAEQANLLSDDGTPLQVLEGIVVDANGKELGPAKEPPRRGGDDSLRPPRAATGVFVMKNTGALGTLLLIPLFALLVTLGLTLFAAVAAASILAWIFYSVFRAVRRL